MLQKLFNWLIYLRYKDYIDIELLETFGDDYIKNPYEYQAYKLELINKYKNPKNYKRNTIKPSNNNLVKKLDYEDVKAIKQKMKQGDILIIKDIDTDSKGNKRQYVSIYHGPKNISYKNKGENHE